MKICYFLNGSRGVTILKNIYKKNLFKIDKIIICKKKNKNLIEKKFSKKIILLQNINSTKSFKKLNELKFDLFILAGYPQILKKKILQIPKIMTINLHGGPLPAYRGGSPLNWQIINQEKEIGISIIKIDEGIDTGDIIEEKKFKLLKNDNIKTIHDKANKHFTEMLFKIIKKLKKGKIFLKKQKYKKKLWKQRRDNDGFLDFKKKNLKESIFFVKALTRPYPGAWSYIFIKQRKKKVRIYNLKKTNKVKLNNPGDAMIIKKKLFIRSLDETCLLTDYILS